MKKTSDILYCIVLSNPIRAYTFSTKSKLERYLTKGIYNEVNGDFQLRVKGVYKISGGKQTLLTISGQAIVLIKGNDHKTDKVGYCAEVRNSNGILKKHSFSTVSGLRSYLWWKFVWGGRRFLNSIEKLYKVYARVLLPLHLVAYFIISVN